jgi:hypothetical protein
MVFVFIQIASADDLNFPTIGLGFSKTTQVFFNDNSSRKLTLQKYSLLAGMKLDWADVYCSFGGTNFVQTQSQSGTPYEHYYYDAGLELRKVLLSFFYVKGSVSYVMFKIKNEENQPSLLDYQVLQEPGVKQIANFVTGFGYGINIPLGDSGCLYAGVVSTAGVLGNDNTETITFSTRNNPEFGAIAYF